MVSFILMLSEGKVNCHSIVDTVSLRVSTELIKGFPFSL
jgi:hypothetical protein